MASEYLELSEMKRCCTLNIQESIEKRVSSYDKVVPMQEYRLVQALGCFNEKKPHTAAACMHAASVKSQYMVYIIYKMRSIFSSSFLFSSLSALCLCCYIGSIIYAMLLSAACCCWLLLQCHRQQQHSRRAVLLLDTVLYLDT